MQPLPLPTDNAQAVYETCISCVRNAKLKGRLKRLAPKIKNADKRYRISASSGALFRTRSLKNVQGVSAKELEKVYTNRMAKKGAPGRRIYDRILASAEHGRCPLCGQRTVSTLDHYLPKAHFPLQAVMPANLVPACQDCNKAKSDSIAKVSSEQTLHPYFDDIDSDEWLVATLVRRRPAAVKFQAVAPNSWSTVMVDRLTLHFDTFSLGTLYASHAAQELVDIRESLSTLFGVGGESAVRDRLAEDHVSRRSARRNSWQSALYKALAQSGWYCRGGFQE